MSRFLGRFRSLLQRDQSSPGPDFAIFGKHPAWGDHVLLMNGQAFPLTAHPPGMPAWLVRVMQTLYFEGIERHGIPFWAGPSAPPDLIPMHHVFLWHTGGQCVVGRLWQSKDAVSRAEFPLVVAARCGGGALGPALEAVLPKFAELESAILGAGSADEMFSLLSSAEDQLAQDLANDFPPSPAPDIFNELASSSAMGRDRIGLARILYTLERLDPTAGGLEPVRVPRCAPSEQRELALWRALVEQKFGPNADSLVLLPVDKSWVDLIVGRVDPLQFRFLRVPSLPLATEIPYPLSPEFLENAQRLCGPQGSAPSPRDATPASMAVSPPA